MRTKTLPERPTGRMTWTYHDEHGKAIFQHYRQRADNLRGKRYGYRYPIDLDERTGCVLEWDYHKHPLADALLYNLPAVLKHPCEDLYWCEGERCSDALISEYGVLATSHHGGAGKATPAQAEWLRGRKGRIFIVADRDDAGTYCAVRRYDLCREVGFPKSRLSIVWPFPTFKGADARDHAEQRWNLDNFVPCKVKELREVAATVTPGNWSGNGSFPDDPNWAEKWRENTARNSQRRS